MATTITKLTHLQIPLEEIVKATNNFAAQKIIGKGGFGVVYKGKLMHSGELINIAARRLDRSHGQGDVEFLKEISVLSILKHDNIVSMIGFCDEKGEKIIVNHYYPKGSLLMHLSNPTLTWNQRLSICIGLVKAILYIHNFFKSTGTYYIIHRNINSSTILLDNDWLPKLSGFEYAIKHSSDRKGQVFRSEAIGTQGYIDPAVEKDGGVTHKSDIYSVGVVLFEILTGRKANEDNKLLVPLINFHYETETLKEIIHPDLWNQMDPESIKCFSQLAYYCLKEERAERPDAGEVGYQIQRAKDIQKKNEEDHQDVKDALFEPLIKALEDTVERASSNFWKDEKDFLLEPKEELGDAVENASLNFWKGKSKDTFRMSFEDIKLATKDFSAANKVGEGGFGRVYRGELSHGNSYGHCTIVAKKLDTRHGQGEKEYYNELQILYEYKHENIIDLVGYSNETNKKIIVYEYAPKGSLDRYLNDDTLTWRNRLNICIDVATGLDFLHGGYGGQEVVVHRDIKTANILLFDDWKAKLGDFELSLISAIDEQTPYSISYACGTMGYVDPWYLNSSLVTVECDIYSFGVVLFEMLYGRPTYVIQKSENWSLLTFIKHNFEDGKQDEVVFKAIKKEIVPQSLTKFLNVVYKCLDDDREKRPTARKVLAELKKAMEFQVSYRNFTKACF